MNETVASSGQHSGCLYALDRRDLIWCVLFVLVFGLSRFVWAYGNISAATYWEEEYRWAAASELLVGPIHSLSEYQADHYQGGSLVMILLVTALFKVFGQAPAVLKLAAILFSSGILGLLYVTAKRGFGRTTALCVATAYLVGPPAVAFWGVAVMGSHGESTLFSLLQILIFFGLQSGAWRNRWGWFFFGVVSGLGLWFCYTSGFSLAACGLAWLLTTKFPKPQEIGWGFLGGFVGLLPWFSYNIDRGFVGLGRIFEVLGTRPGPDPWIEQGVAEKLQALVFQDWPGGMLYPFPELRPESFLGLSLVLFSAPWALGLLLSGLRVLRAATKRWMGTEEEARELVFLLYGALFLIFFVVSSFTIDPNKGPHEYRLFIPVATLLLVPAARSVALGWDARGWGRMITAGALASFLILSSLGTLAVASRPLPPGAFAGDLGSMVRGLLLHRKYETNLDTAMDLSAKISDPLKRWAAFRGIGWGVAFRFEEGGDLALVKKELRRVKPPNRAAFRSGLRWAAETRKLDVERRLAEGIARPDSKQLLSRFNVLLLLTEPAAKPGK